MTIWSGIAPALTALRSVLMKPEHFEHVPYLHECVIAAL